MTEPVTQSDTIPNATTVEVLNAVKNGDVDRFDTVEAVMANLNKPAQQPTLDPVAREAAYARFSTAGGCMEDMFNTALLAYKQADTDTARIAQLEADKARLMEIINFLPEYAYHFNDEHARKINEAIDTHAANKGGA